MPDGDDIACGLALSDDWGDITFVPHARTLEFTATARTFAFHGQARGLSFTTSGRNLRLSGGVTMSTVDATPNTLDMGAGESLALSFDFTDDVAGGDTVASTVITLIDLTSGVSYPSGLSGGPTALVLSVTQEVTALVAGHTYHMVVAATMTPSGQTYEMGLTITCPY